MTSLKNQDYQDYIFQFLLGFFTSSWIEASGIPIELFQFLLGFFSIPVQQMSNTQQSFFQFLLGFFSSNGITIINGNIPSFNSF